MGLKFDDPDAPVAVSGDDGLPAWMQHDEEMTGVPMLARASVRAAPTNVAWLEQASGVYPAETQTFRSQTKYGSHVSSERRELVPLFAHCAWISPHDHRPAPVHRMRTAPVKVPTRVMRLFNVAGPANVIRIVIASRIRPAIERSAWWPGSEQALDVFSEQADVMPAITDCDAPGTVIPVLPATRVITPPHHVCPKTVELPVNRILPGEAVNRSSGHSSILSGEKVMTFEDTDAPVASDGKFDPEGDLPWR